jgi:type 1 fimbria pilin
MKRISSFAASLVILVVFAGSAFAATIVMWADGYPKTGTQNGTILVKGKFMIPACTTFKGCVASYWVDGGQIKTQNVAFNACTGDWGETAITGLTSGTTYNVVVQCTAQLPCGMQLVYGSQPKTAVAR